MQYLIKLTSLIVCISAATAYGLVPPPPADAGADRLPGDSGTSVSPPAADAGTMPEPGSDAAPVADTGVYPDTGCPDGICCLVLPDWEAGSFDAGPVDIGLRRRQRTTPDAGPDAPGGGFGCSASGVSSLLWLLPLAVTRRRRRS
jgi:hypothetical protein